MRKKDNSLKSLERREFLRFVTTLGGAAALASILEGCSRAGIEEEMLVTPSSAPEGGMQPLEPAPATQPANEGPAPTETNRAATAAPTDVVQDGKTRIAFVKTNNRAKGVRQAVELLGINPAEGKRVFLKPNFNSADPAPGSTHPEILASLVSLLKEMGARKITVGERSGMGDTRRVMEQIGVFQLSEEMGFDTLVFDELPADDWVMVEPSGGHWERGFPFARACLEAEAIVQTCCLKTHRYGGHFTLSLKNSVGLVGKRLPQQEYDFMQELHSSPHQRRMIAEINAAYSPALVVMDGVEAFISGGPDQGERVTPEVILAGTDRIALDAVGIAILRHFGCKTEAGMGKIFEQEQIARAVELGLGVDSSEKIEFLTGDPDSAAYGNQIQAILRAG